MGIPSYFSYIIKNHKNIIHKLKDCKRFQHVFMDCNSLIYDSFYDIENKYHKKLISLPSNGKRQLAIEEMIICSVIERIEQLIDSINPEISAYITFDGVAPFAKMNQQKSRRYKSHIMSQIIPSAEKIWNTSYITPGTPFMDALSKRIYKKFNGLKKPYKIRVSCADVCGEGEHKIFELIRKENFQNDQIAIYGLDSDLIMLSIFHRQFAKNIFVFREAPNFKNSLQTDCDDPTEKLFMDIHELSVSIFAEMGSGSSQYDIRRVYDYIFICFLLGNDFLPHIISLNIRTTGIQNILNTYKYIIGNYPERSLISTVNESIQWNYVKMFIDELARIEHQNFIHEHTLRDKFDSRTWSSNTPEEVDQLIQNIPIIYRQEERYICPQENGWETRYYKALFHAEDNKEDIVQNYIEGLHWVFEYYIHGVKNNKWSYRYHYAPLLRDLKYAIGKTNTNIVLKEEKPCTANEQLEYVLPRETYELCFGKTENREVEEITAETMGLKWAYCRYLWESHPMI